MFRSQSIPAKFHALPSRNSRIDSFKIPISHLYNNEWKKITTLNTYLKGKYKIIIN